MNWFERKRFKRERRQLARDWVKAERAERGYVMHMLREQGEWRDAEYL
jgi:hypothetical protein